MEEITVEARVTGRVQGVGYRFWVKEQAETLGLRGWIQNEPDRSVAALFVGSEAAVGEMVAALKDGPPAAIVADVTSALAEGSAETGDLEGFHITG
jgi:acylphosphatase